ncbi:MAG: hypothetical protein V2A56_06055 [bacterium]
MTRTLAILMAVVMLVPVVFADDMHQNTAPSNQPENSGQPVGTMVGTGMMVQNAQPVIIDTPVEPNPMMPTMMNEMRAPGTMPLAGLFDLGLTAKQVEKLVDLRAELWKDQIPLVQQMMTRQEDLTVLEQSSPPDYSLIKDAKKSLVDLETDLRQLNDRTIDKAMKVLSDDQKEALGNRPLPLFMMEGASNSRGGHPRWGMHRGMMGARSDEKSNSNGNGGK